MTLLEAARLLAKIGPPTTCEYTFDEHGHITIMACCGASTLGPHLPTCPWLTMPRVVAALEAAGWAVEGMGESRRLGLSIDETVARLGALADALKGEG